MKNNPINGIYNKVRNPLDRCTCQVVEVSYGLDPFGQDMVQEIDVACEQCKDMEFNNDMSNVGGSYDCEVAVYEVAHSPDYGFCYAQRVYQGPLQKHQIDIRPRIVWITHEEANRHIQSTIEPDDLPF